MKRVLLIGLPNAGKTALFNALTESNQRVANISGVTFEPVEAPMVGSEDSSVFLMDLPGNYSFRNLSSEERVPFEILNQENFEVVVTVVDGIQLDRSLRYLEECAQFLNPKKWIIAVNMIDLAERRKAQLDLQKTADHFGASVFAISAVRRHGLKELSDCIFNSLKSHETEPSLNRERLNEWSLRSMGQSHEVLSFFKKVSETAKQLVKSYPERDVFTERLDQVFLSGWTGIPTLLLVLFLMFQSVFSLASYPMDAIDWCFQSLSGWVSAQEILPELFRSFLADGLIAGIGGALVFLPQILILFGFILFLEDFGFMSRSVFLLDRMFRGLGLSGAAFLPLLSGFACAVPALMSSRALSNPIERLKVMFLIPMMSCSARIPVYVLLVSAFIPNVSVGFGLSLQAIVLFSLYALGIIAGILIAGIYRLFEIFFHRSKEHAGKLNEFLLLEMPTYKNPSLKTWIRGLKFRAQIFIRKVGTVLVALNILVWVLVSFPSPGEKSIAAKLGRGLEPIMSPLGFDWKISMSLIPSFAAREVMVTAVATAYRVSEEEGGRLGEILAQNWTIPTSLSLLVWFVFAPQCLSTFAVMRRESGSLSFTMFTFLALLFLAYLASFLTYRIALSFGL